jgi:hypothetical protein
MIAAALITTAALALSPAAGPQGGGSPPKVNTFIVFTGLMTLCEHSWYWRRKRNQKHGYWECPRCGSKSGRVGLDENGRPVEGPDGSVDA